jgi:hypothetical protein
MAGRLEQRGSQHRGACLVLLGANLRGRKMYIALREIAETFVSWSIAAHFAFKIIDAAVVEFVALIGG